MPSNNGENILLILFYVICPLYDQIYQNFQILENKLKIYRDLTPQNNLILQFTAPENESYRDLTFRIEIPKRFAPLRIFGGF